MPNIQLSNNLRYLRKQEGLTQDQMGALLNISSVMIDTRQDYREKQQQQNL